MQITWFSYIYKVLEPFKVLHINGFYIQPDTLHQITEVNIGKNILREKASFVFHPLVKPGASSLAKAEGNSQLNS